MSMRRGSIPYPGHGDLFQPFRCPMCGGVRWVAYWKLGCRDGHPDVLMDHVPESEGDPVTTQGLNTFIPEG